MPWKYSSGEEIRPGDQIRYGGRTGKVEFMIAGPTGRADLDYYLQVFPAGGFMLQVEAIGYIFLDEGDEDLELISRTDD